MPTPVHAFNGTKLQILFSNGASPPTYAEKCMINTSRGIQFTADMTESLVPFCPPDDELPAWKERVGDGLSATINGAGICHSNDVEFFSDWLISQEIKDIRVAIDEVHLSGHWSGEAVLQSFELTGSDRRSKVTFASVIMSNADWRWSVDT